MTVDAELPELVRKPQRHRLPRFPVRWILEQPQAENWIVKAVWFVIPVEYYLVTTFSSGFDRSELGAAAVFSLLYLILLFAVSSGLALPGKRREYDSRLRMWSIALIVTWGASAAVVAGANFLSRIWHLPNDVVAITVCRRIGPCVPDYPSWTLATFVIYSVYSAIALAVLWGVSRYLRSFPAGSPARPPNSDWSDPNIFLVGAINAVIMTIMHGLANSG